MSKSYPNFSSAATKVSVAALPELLPSPCKDESTNAKPKLIASKELAKANLNCRVRENLMVYLTLRVLLHNIDEY